MTMTNVNVQAVEIAPLGGATNDGWRIGYIASGAKAAQNDTWTVANASSIKSAFCTLDATGGVETATVATNVITLTSATATACSGLVVYKVK